MAKKKPATKAEREYMNRVVELGCIACLNLGHTGTPAEIHHTRCNAGGAQRSPHTMTLPLCPWHHRTGGHGEAIHAGQETWEAKFGTEQELLDQVEAML